MAIDHWNMVLKGDFLLRLISNDPEKNGVISLKSRVYFGQKPQAALFDRGEYCTPYVG